MIRSLTAKNFIHFLDGIKLTFDAGVYFFVGRSATGKSAAIELICRSHDSKLNEATLSTIPNEKETAYAFCLYKSVEEGKLFLTGIFTDPSIKKIYRIVVVERQNCRTVYAKELPYYLGNIPQSKIHHVDPFEVADEKFKLQTFDEDNFFHLVKLIKQKRQETSSNSNKINIDTILHDLLDSFAATLPHRGISPVSWTRQLTSQNDENKDLCSEGSKRADVLHWLLDDDTNVDQVRAKRIFDQLCSDPYKFIKMKNGDIVVQDSAELPVPLIKVPAGVFEAKELSLLLAHKKIKTLCLEEPYRGMHQGMIKKLGKLILQRITDKTVLVVSHEQALVNPWSLQRTFVFKKSWTEKKNTVINEVLKFPYACFKYGDNEDMKSVLFSSGVNFVEGETDRLIMQALFDQIVQTNKHETLQKLLNNINSKTSVNDDVDKCNQDIVEATFARLDVIKLDGDKSGLARQKFCNDIGVPCVLILDRNAVLRNHFPSVFKDIYISNDRFQESMSTPFQNEDDWNARYDVTSKYLEERNIFAWKEGDIEDVLIKEIPPESEVYKQFGLEVLSQTKASRDSKESKRKRKEWKTSLKSHDPSQLNELVISALGQQFDQSSFRKLILFLVQKFSFQTLHTSICSKS